MKQIVTETVHVQHIFLIVNNFAALTLYHTMHERSSILSISGLAENIWHFCNTFVYQKQLMLATLGYSLFQWFSARLQYLQF